MFCAQCRKIFLNQTFGRLNRNDFSILNYLSEQGAVEPQIGKTQVEIWSSLQTRMGFQTCREAILGLYKAGLVERTRMGRREEWYLTAEGMDILRL